MRTQILTGLSLLLITGGCQSTAVTPTQATGYQLVLQTDKDGNVLFGSKSDLISAVQSGAEVRIYTGGESFGHSADATFLTVFEGDVFAQISPIESQAPTDDPKQMLFRKPGVKWRSIVGTNGFFTALMDGNEPNVRTGGAKWFIRS